MLGDPEMGECSTDVPEMGLPSCADCLGMELCLCVWVKYVVCCSNMFCLVLLLCSCEV